MSKQSETIKKAVNADEKKAVSKTVPVKDAKKVPAKKEKVSGKKEAKGAKTEEKLAKPKIILKKKKKKVLRHVPSGRVYVSSSYNNTLVTITDADGNALSQSSAGASGFKGARRGTPYAASVATKNAVIKAKGYGLGEADVFVKGIGSGRESAVRALHAEGIEVLSIKDVTPIPHGGCRAKKIRRV